MADWPHPPNWRAVALAAALALAPVGARAVDLPPAPDLPPVVAGAQGADDFSGWYLRGDLGAGAETAPDLASAGPTALAIPGGPVAPAAFSFGRATTSPAASLDGGVGYVFNSWLRADMTLEYRFGSRLAANYRIADPAPLAAGRLAASAASLVALVNGSVDLGNWWGVTPFVGASVGVADNALSGVSDHGLAFGRGGVVVPVGGFVANASRTNFAWALTAGLDVDIAPNLKLELSYRYLNLGAVALGSRCVPACAGATGRVLASNDVRIGLVYLIGEPAAPAARP